MQLFHRAVSAVLLNEQQLASATAVTEALLQPAKPDIDMRSATLAPAPAACAGPDPFMPFKPLPPALQRAGSAAAATALSRCSTQLQTLLLRC